MKYYNKLVRDKIPDIIKKKGEKCSFHVLTNKEYLFELNKKLQEEMQEYLASEDIEELADLEEVLRAILEYKNYSYEEFEKIRKSKVNKKGAFKNKIYLESTD